MQTSSLAQATFAGGCFWCIEAVFSRVRGVLRAESGYSNGQDPHPNYESVCSGKTGHAEVVQVTYDPAEVTYAELLDVFFTVHDPTTLNRQGNDVGTQYRSAIYWTTDAQREAVLRSRDAFQAALSERGRGQITTELAEAGPFYWAEDYHQQYLQKNPGGYCGLGGTGVTCPIGAGVSAA
jgi:peptide-methionine (S)-S-oxide reductase